MGVIGSVVSFLWSFAALSAQGHIEHIRNDRYKWIYTFIQLVVERFCLTVSFYLQMEGGIVTQLIDSLEDI